MRNKCLACLLCLLGLIVIPPLAEIAETAPLPDLSNIYIGCLHSAHTKISDGRFTYPEEFYSAFTPYWDWIATTDHDGMVDAIEWRSMIGNAYAYKSITFASLLGYEWSSPTYGHMSVVFGGNSSSTGRPFSWRFENKDGSIATFEHTRKEAYDGFYSINMKKTNTGGYSTAVLSPYIPVSGLTEYVLSGWAKTNLQGDASARLRIRWYDSDWGYISDGHLFFSARDDWHERSGSFVSPARATRAVIDVGVWSDIGEAYFDKLGLKMISDTGYYHEHANIGVIKGGSWTIGTQMYALSFDGVDDHVEVPDSLSLKPTSGHLTIALWLNPQTGYGQVNPRLVEKYGDNLVYTLQIHASTGEVAFGLRIGGIDQALATEETVPVGVWTHLVATFDGEHMRIFCNGVQKAVSPKYVGTLNLEESDVRIGGIGGRFYKGSIDELRIYNRSLSLPEITTLYGGDEPNITDLVLRYTFDENRGDIVRDYSPIYNLIDNPSFEVEESLANSFSTEFDTPHELYSFLAERDGLAVFAHPAGEAHHISFFNSSTYKNDAYAPLVSIVNSGLHWNDYWNYANGTDIVNPWSVPNAYAEGYVKRGLDSGYHLGFVGELDLHTKIVNRSEYAYTGVVVETLTREEIFEALKSRHTFAVWSPFGLGKKILLKSTAGNFLMGDIFEHMSNKIEIVLEGQTDLKGFMLINMFVNGIIVESRPVSTQSLNERFHTSLNNGRNYVFFEVRAYGTGSDISYAFTSPMFVTVEPKTGYSPNYLWVVVGVAGVATSPVIVYIIRRRKMRSTGQKIDRSSQHYLRVSGKNERVQKTLWH